MYSTSKQFQTYQAIAKDWETIIRYLFKHSDTFSLITSTPHPYSEREVVCVHDELLRPLEPFLISQKVGIRKWPGTETRDIHKVLKMYRSCSKARDILLTWGNVFWALDLDLPEDITFYRGGKVIFCTISHEAIVFFDTKNHEDGEFFSKYQ